MCPSQTFFLKKKNIYIYLRLCTSGYGYVHSRMNAIGAYFRASIFVKQGGVISTILWNIYNDQYFVNPDGRFWPIKTVPALKGIKYL